jgi:hypothetical protein
MATYTTAEFTKHATTAAGVQDSVTLGANFNRVEVLNRSTTDYLSVLVDSDATISAAFQDGTTAVPPNSSVILASQSNDTTEVKLFSTGAADYTIEGVIGE